MTTASFDPLFLSGAGIAAAILGSAAGSASGSGASAYYLMSVHHHKPLTNFRQAFLPFVPIVISGVLAIYGLIVAVLIHGKVFGTSSSETDAVTGYKCLTAGVVVGLATWTSGAGIAYFISKCCQPMVKNGNGPTAATLEQVTPLIPSNSALASSTKPLEPSIFMVMSLAFLEAIGLYGLMMACLIIGTI